MTEIVKKKRFGHVVRVKGTLANNVVRVKATLANNVVRVKGTLANNVVRVKGTLANNLLSGKVEGKRSRGRSARQWLDDVKEWTTRKASKTVDGRCKGMDHEEGPQDSGWTM